MAIYLVQEYKILSAVKMLNFRWGNPDFDRIDCKLLLLLNPRTQKLFYHDLYNVLAT